MNNIQKSQEDILLHIAETIKLECKSQNVTMSKMLQDCEISKSFIYDLEKRNVSPSIDKMLKIAQYLNCSLDYLTGNTNNYNSNISVNTGNININKSPKASVEGNSINFSLSSINNEIIEELKSILKDLSLKEKADFINAMYQFKK
ncbi:MAG: helix-turn-helix domain-containing protein [Ruminococcus sp.]|nr:helix-turn-helix domain-containing protein [Ruminococcus sp.]